MFYQHLLTRQEISEVLYTCVFLFGNCFGRWERRLEINIIFIIYYLELVKMFNAVPS